MQESLPRIRSPYHGDYTIDCNHGVSTNMREQTCVSQPTTEPTKALESTPSSTPCVCEPMACPQIWPGSCVCANGIAQRCYEKCGGPVPVLLPCPLVPEVTPIPTPVSDPVSGPVASCTCEKVMCIDQFPESCYCANAAAQRCYKKCGGKKPAKQVRFDFLPPLRKGK